MAAGVPIAFQEVLNVSVKKNGWQLRKDIFWAWPAQWEQ